MKTLKKIFLQIIFSLIFLMSSLAFIMFAKAKLTAYIGQLQGYTNQIYALRNTITATEGTEQLQALLETISPTIQKAAYFTYIIAPLTLFMLWLFFIGTTFYLARKPAGKYCTYILSFAIVSVAPFVIASYLLIKILQLGGLFLLSGTGLGELWIYVALLLAISYFTLVAYALIGKQPLLQLPLKTLKLALKRIYLFLPLFMALILIILVILSITFSAYLSILSPDISILYNTIALVITLSLALLLRNFLLKMISRYCHSP